MDFSTILQQHGLAGAVIAALAWAWQKERARNDTMTDSRIADLQKYLEGHASVAREASASIDAMARALESRQ